MTISVLLVDDQALIRAGFRMILSAEADLRVVGEAEDGDEAIRLATVARPGCRAHGHPDAEDRWTSKPPAGSSPSPDHARSVVILTTFERDDYVFEALRVGASGFLLKNAPPEELLHAVRVVAEGNALLSPSVTRRVIEQYAATAPASKDVEDDLDRLTDREREVLRSLAAGKSNAEVASSLYVGEGTVKTHVSHILTKLCAADRMQAVVFAYESGLITPEQRPDLRPGRGGPGPRVTFAMPPGSGPAVSASSRSRQRAVDLLRRRQLKVSGSPRPPVPARAKGRYAASGDTGTYCETPAHTQE